MGATLAGLSMCFAMCRHWSWMAFSLCVMTDQMMRAWQLCTSHTAIIPVISDLVCRQVKEHSVFCELFQSVPGLENRLMTSSEEEVMVIADLLCGLLNYLHISSISLYVTNRFRRVPMVPGPMTPREWRVRSLIRSLQKVNPWPLISLVMLNLAMDLTMTALALSYVLQVSIGIT